MRASLRSNSAPPAEFLELTPTLPAWKNGANSVTYAHDPARHTQQRPDSAPFRPCIGLASLRPCSCAHNLLRKMHKEQHDALRLTQDANGDARRGYLLDDGCLVCPKQRQMHTSKASL